MKRALALALTTAMLLTTAAGCSSGTTASTSATGTSTADKVKKVPSGSMVVSPVLIGYENAEISISWQPNPSQGLKATSKERVKYLTQKATDWVKAHPNVKILPVETSSNSNDAATKLKLQVTGDTAPDAAAVDSFMLSSFTNSVQPWNDAYAKKGINMDDYYPFIKKVVQPDGKNILADWYTTDVRALFYRKDLISTPPKTVKDVIAAGKQLKSKGMTGLLYVAGRNEGSVNNQLGIYWSQGSKLFTDDGKPTFASGKDKTSMLNFLHFFEDTIKEGVAPKTVAQYSKEADMFGQIASGKYGMFVSSSSAVTQLREVMGKDNFDTKWAVTELPVVNQGDQSTSSAGGWTNVIFTKDKEKADLAADFILSLYSDDNAAGKWCEIGGFLPTRKSVYQKTPYFAKDEYFKSFSSYLDHAQTRPAVKAYSELSNQLQIAIGNIVTGSKTSESALDQVLQNTQK